jgi:hypothetical protein
MNAWLKALTGVLAAGVFFLFFVYVPFLRGTPNQLDDLRNYFTIAGVFVTAVVGSLGVVLGGYYYFDRKRHDSGQKKKEEVRAKLRLLLDELHHFDDLLVRFFTHDFADQQELDRLRHKISRSFEMVEMVLESEGETIGLSQEELVDFVKVNSFVDKSDTIMRTKHAKLKRAQIAAEQDRYIELIKAAKRVCVRRAI